MKRRKKGSVDGGAGREGGIRERGEGGKRMMLKKRRKRLRRNGRKKREKSKKGERGGRETQTVKWWERLGGRRRWKRWR